MQNCCWNRDFRLRDTQWFCESTSPRFCPSKSGLHISKILIRWIFFFLGFILFSFTFFIFMLFIGGCYFFIQIQKWGKIGISSVTHIVHLPAKTTIYSTSSNQICGTEHRAHDTEHIYTIKFVFFRCFYFHRIFVSFQCLEP